MRIPFAWKMGIALILLSVTATGVGVFWVYNNTRAMVLDQMRNRLMDLGRAGAYVFGEQERQDILFLRSEQARLNQFQATAAQIADLNGPDGIAGTEDDGTFESLQSADASRLMQSAPFLRIVQALRKIREGSRALVRPLGEVPPLHLIRKNAKDTPSIEYIYLLSAMPQQKPQDYLIYLVDADYLPVDDDGTGEPYEGNPIGTATLPLTPEMAAGFNGKAEAEQDFSEDQWGDVVISGYVPILDKQGEVIAVIGMDYNALGAANKLKRLWQICLAAVALSILLSIIFSIALARLLNKPIRMLKEGASRVADGDYSVSVELKRKDELGVLADTFNNMVDEIRSNTINLTELNQAYERFVPKEFLRHMGTDDIKKLKLGDQVQSEMSVLFSDIRSFTTLSEQMSPHDNFDFLNSYLQKVSPKIRSNNGFIDKFIGDAIMALFPDQVDNALQAAIDMQSAVAEYNVKRVADGHEPIRIGIGIHVGMLMLGTIGEARRMEGTVISDAVNLASRLEGLTKRFGAKIMTSEYTLSRLQETRSKYYTRYLGRVRVKGKSEPTKVYEIMNCDPEATIQLKLQTMERFEEAIELFNRGKFGEAGGLFAEIIAVMGQDVASEVYLERCNRMIRHLD
ncbi:MAG: HAMP domain-containing protein [Leptospiraceae bacterium]|nr:HAMP domain-containing protein [Leptospiraceae bacterium]